MPCVCGEWLKFIFCFGSTFESDINNILIYENNNDNRYFTTMEC